MASYKHFWCIGCKKILSTDSEPCNKCSSTDIGFHWRYRKRIALPDGRKIRIAGTPTLNTKGASDAAEREAVNSYLHPELAELHKPTSLPSDVLTVSEYIPTFLDEYAPDGKPSAARTRKQYLNHSIKPFFGHLRLDEIRQAHVNQYIKANAGKNAQTIRNALYALAAMLKYAADNELIARHNLRFTVKATHELKIEATPQDHIRKLLKVCTDIRFRVAILLASECGLRIGEVRAAQWADIKDGAITVRRQVDDRNLVGPPKHHHVRSVPLSASTEAALKKLPKTSLWLLTRLDDSDKGRQGQKRASLPGGFLGYAGMCKILSRLYRAAQLGEPGKDISPWHSLRHAYGTKLASAGVPVTTIRELMGHADVRTTQRYITTTEDQKAAAVARVF